MKKVSVIGKSLIIFLLFAVTFTSLPMMTEGISAHAATYLTPGNVTGAKATVKSSTAVRLTWKKASRTNTGYIIYQNGKNIKLRNKKYLYFDVTKLKPATKYSFRIRAYNKYVRKQYYNTTSRKWQYSRPASRNWKTRKTRNVNYYKFGKITNAMVVATPPTTPAKVTGVTASALSSTSIKVSWTKLSKNVYRYVIYRNGKEIARVGSGTRSLTDNNLKASTSYTYQVRAYNYSTKVKKGKYGAYSDKKSAKTSAISVIVSGGSGTSNDSVFAGSSLQNKTFYLDTSYNGGALSFNLKTKKEDDADAIKWKSSKTSVATVEKALFNGTAATITIKGVGETTVTATNWDGQTKTCKITVKATANSPEDPVIEEPDNGIAVYSGKVYPSEDGVFDLSVGDYYDFKIGSVDVSMKEIPTAFPDGTTFRINASDMIKETDYYLDGVLQSGVHSQKGYSIGSVGISNISDKTKIIYAPSYSMDSSAGGLFFLSSGTCNVTYGNGTTHTFVISGSNAGMTAYRNFVKDFVDNTSGKSENEIALAAISEALSFKYGFTNDPFAMVTSNAGGNCFAKAQLVHRLLAELGVECYEHLAYRDNNARHMVLEIIIGGNTYIADPTNREDLLSWEEYESITGRSIERNRDTFGHHPSIVY